MSRLSLADLNELVYVRLGEDWVTPTTMCHLLGWSGSGRGWYVVALALERLANDGEAEIQIRGNRRYFRGVQ